MIDLYEIMGQGWDQNTKLWDRAGIKIMTPGSAVRHVTDSAKGLGPERYVVTCGV